MTKVNFGIWNAALLGSSYLKDQFGVRTHMIVCQNRDIDSPVVSVPVIWVGKRPSIKHIVNELYHKGIDPSSAVVVSHGCWLQPTRIAFQLKKKGFHWIYTPQGMLEPWSIRQKGVKKRIYFSLFEKRWSSQCDSVRAVSNEEFKNLLRIFNQPVVLIENGVQVPDYLPKPDGPEIYLFLARLHHKKGVLPLVKAWNKSMRNELSKKLIIAGPDEGELKKIAPFLSGNIEYVGPAFGENKKQLLRRSHYYVLPSYSEGFPTSVVEAMSYGVIPVISSGCNFPEVFDNKLGYRVEPDENNIASQFVALKDMPFNRERSKCNHDFVEKKYSEPAIAGRLYSAYLWTIKA
jgi:glycosyltransferase involved in cell wall biosynthesis